MGDLDESGWFNIDLGDSSFVEFEGVTVCVDEVMDGGGGESEGGGDESPADDSPTALFPVKGVTSYPPAGVTVVEGAVIVQFRKGVFAPNSNSASDGSIASVTLHSSPLSEALEQARIEAWSRLAWHPSSSWSPNTPFVITRDGFWLNYENRARTYILRGRATTRQMLKELEAVSETYVYAEPLMAGELFDFPTEPDSTPSDSLYRIGEQEWAEPIDTSGSPLSYGIDVAGAWKWTTGNPAIRLGIVDKGVKPFHPDFVTYPDSVLVFDFYDTCWPDDSLTPWASSSHGTAVIGIAAGLTHNRRDPADTMFIGTAGVAGGVDADSLTMVRTTMYHIDNSALPECAAPSNRITALDRAIVDGIDILNFSNGAYGFAFAEALTRAYQGGISIVAAVGNFDAPNFRPLPAASQTNRTIAVSNGRITGERWLDSGSGYGSSYGRWNDIMAPGEEALAPTWEDPWWAPFASTSAASPMVAGTAALIASQLYDTYGEHSLHEELEALIIAGAVETQADIVEGHDKYYGHGFLNARNSMAYTNPDRFRRGRFTVSGLDGDSVTFHGTKSVILGTAGEYITVVSPLGDTLVDGEYSDVQVYKAIKTVGLHGQYTGDSVLVAGIGHGLPAESFQSNGWANGDSIKFADSLGTLFEKAVLFRDRYCIATLLPSDQIQLSAYFWRFPLSPIDTVWAPFDPTDSQNEVSWAYTVIGKVDPTSMPASDLNDPKGQIQIFETIPNPFNPSVEVQYHLAEAGVVDISVFDITGRRVRLLHHAMVEPQFRSIAWDGHNDAGQPVASGTYFIKINTANTQKTAKITLVR